MNPRSPYLASSLLHATLLSAAAALSVLQRPAPFVPSVRIVTLGGGPRSEDAPTTGTAKSEAVAEKPRAVNPPPPPVPKPEPKPKQETKTPPPRPPAKAPEKSGTLSPQKREIVSKGPAVAPAASSTQTRTASAPAGAAGGGVGVEAEGDSGPLSGYLGLLRDRVANAWVAPAVVGRNGEVRCEVFFLIERRGGQPLDLVVEVSSGDPGFDRAAMRAVLNAAPLAPLPAAWGTDTIGIRFTFFQTY